MLEEHLESAKRWIEFIRRENPDLIWRKGRNNDYNDWLNGNRIKKEGWPTGGAEVPNDVFATAFFAHSADLVSRMARALGRRDDARRHARLFEEIREAFNRSFVKPGGLIQGDTQAGYALALDFNLLPGSLRPGAVEHMVEGIHRYKEHLSTGIQSTIRLLLELTRNGRNELAWHLVRDRTFPSWGYMIENGATTIWERWDGYVKGRGFQNPGMNSFNHWAFGSVGEWMVRNILGIQPDEKHPGYRRFTIHPRPGGGVTWARGSYDSIRGRIESGWRIEGGRFRLQVKIPANTTARVHLPAGGPAEVTESGKPVREVNSVKFLGKEGNGAVFEVGSGSYEFVAPGPAASKEKEG
jgi:alpha-L-rhamnosidase